MSLAILRTLALILLLALFRYATAADAKGNFVVISFGTVSCGQVVSDFDTNERQKLLNSVWVGGYLTAINQNVFAGADIAKGTDPAARDLWIYNYCKANPLDNLHQAANALVLELSRRTK